MDDGNEVDFENKLKEILTNQDMECLLKYRKFAENRKREYENFEEYQNFDNDDETIEKRKK